jgi:MFS family permease
MIYALCMAVCGMMTAIMPFLTSYTGLCIAAGGFGMSIAANYSMASIILVELITLERFTNAYGLLLLIQGLANLVGPPLAGMKTLCFTSMLKSLHVLKSPLFWEVLPCSVQAVTRSMLVFCLSCSSALLRFK